MPKIDKDKPLPGKGRKYPFAELKVGESFFTEGARANRQVSTATRNYPGLRFMVRQCTENGVLGARCWRIE